MTCTLMSKRNATGMVQSIRPVHTVQITTTLYLGDGSGMGVVLSIVDVDKSVSLPPCAVQNEYK